MSKFYKTNAAEGWNKKFPEQIAVATTVDKNGIPNAITLGWAMVTSLKPPMMAISIGHTRYSHELLKECKEFVLAFPDETALDKMMFCGTKSGMDYKDKLKLCSWETEKAIIVKPPLLTQCTVNFECKVTGTMETGDHTIFAGEIVATHIAKKQGKRLYNFGSGIFKPIG